MSISVLSTVILTPFSNFEPTNYGFNIINSHFKPIYQFFQIVNNHFNSINNNLNSINYNISVMHDLFISIDKAYNTIYH